MITHANNITDEKMGELSVKIISTSTALLKELFFSPGTIIMTENKNSVVCYNAVAVEIFSRDDNSFTQGKKHLNLFFLPIPPIPHLPSDLHPSDASSSRSIWV